MKPFLLTVIGLLLALSITTVALDAADTLSGSQGTLLAQVFSIQKSICPQGMTHFPAGKTFTCVDTYEAAPGPGCTIENPQNQFHTEANIAQNDCQPVSEPSLLPWRFVSREQARVLCTKVGKRLPTVAEWYELALGTKEDTCLVRADGPVAGDAQAGCVSAGGVVGAVGNVWEWVSDEVVDGQLNGRSLPETGYILATDAAGVATLTGYEASTTTLPGYFWSESGGVYGILRGGFYGSRADGGVYAMHAHTDPRFIGAAVGFRCVR